MFTAEPDCWLAAPGVAAPALACPGASAPRVSCAALAPAVVSTAEVLPTAYFAEFAALAADAAVPVRELSGPVTGATAEGSTAIRASRPVIAAGAGETGSPPVRP